MKYIIIILLTLITSCNTGTKQREMEKRKLELRLDSMQRAQDDSLKTAALEKRRLPSAMDGSFADFLYAFAESRATQQARTSFPLPFIKDNNDTTYIYREKWQYNPLFSTIDNYTIIRESINDEEEDHSGRAVLEWLYLHNKDVVAYHFNKINGAWMLTRLEEKKIYKEDNHDTENFLDFYLRFSTDTAFQSTRLASPLKLITFDPEDEFSIIETSIAPEEWPAFRPELPGQVITNIDFCTNHKSDSDCKIFEIKGFSNGFDNLLWFRLVDGLWKLEQFEDLSD